MGCGDGSIYIFSPGGTILWNYALPNDISVPAVMSEDTLYLASNGLFYAFTAGGNDAIPWFESELFIIVVSASGGGALLCMVLTAVGVVCVVMYVRRRQQLHEALNKELLVAGVLDAASSDDEENPLLSATSSFGEFDNSMMITREGEAILQRACKEKWFISYKGLSLQQKIAVGGVGTIYRAKWRGTDVAIKVIFVFIFFYAITCFYVLIFAII